MRIYPKYHNVPVGCTNSASLEADQCVSSDSKLIRNDKMSSSSFVYCIDDAVPQEITDAMYHYTTQTNLPQKTWGTYITMEKIQKYWNSTSTGITNGGTDEASHGRFHFDTSPETQSKEDNIRHLDAIAVPAAAYFMKNYVSCHTTVQNGYNVECPNLFRGIVRNTDNTNPMEETSLPIDMSTRSNHDRCFDGHTGKIYDEAHGIAVWALVSEIGSEVPYHIDYAELLRYETGIIVPPIIAGTWHCTHNPNHTYFRGGDYCVVVRQNGLDHYHKHGYKGKLTPVGETSRIDTQGSNDILQLQYKFNRMICQSGDLPHWSTRVDAPTVDVTGKNACSVSDLMKEKNGQRVIVGFNVFLHDVGPVIQQAPEHSEAFRQRVIDRKRQNGKLLLHAFTTNPQLRRLLILASRQKNLNQFQYARNDLDKRMQLYIKSQNEPVTVGQILDTFTPSKSTNHWPFDVNDVLVHIHNACKKGTLRVTGTDKSEKELTKLIGREVFIECCSEEHDATVQKVNQIF